MSTYHSESSDHSTFEMAGQKEKTGREVICEICQAVYVPSRTQRRLARSPQALVESAFMSMCHFCFRCRRPACPSCWDEVHGVCGACVLDTQLQFRSEASPLDGVLFPSIDQSEGARVHTLTPPLVCIRPGRFQRAPLPIETQTTLFLQTVPDLPTYNPSKKPLSQKIPIPKPLADIADIVTRPEKRQVRSEDGGLEVTIQQNRLEHIITDMVLVIVLLIGFFVVGALIFPSVNDSIAYFLHVDIRAGIAYLLQLIQHLF